MIDEMDWNKKCCATCYHFKHGGCHPPTNKVCEVAKKMYNNRG